MNMVAHVFFSLKVAGFPPLYNFFQSLNYIMLRVKRRSFYMGELYFSSLGF